MVFNAHEITCFANCRVITTTHFQNGYGSLNHCSDYGANWNHLLKIMLVLCMRNAAVGKHLVSKSATSRVPLISDTDQLLKNLLLDPLYLYFDVAGSSGQINAFQKLQTWLAIGKDIWSHYTFEVTTKSFILNDLRIRETILLKTKLSWQIVWIPVISPSHADRKMDCWCREYDLMRAPKKVKTPSDTLTVSASSGGMCGIGVPNYNRLFQIAIPKRFIWAGKTQCNIHITC